MNSLCTSEATDMIVTSLSVDPLKCLCQGLGESFFVLLSQLSPPPSTKQGPRSSGQYGKTIFSSYTQVLCSCKSSCSSPVSEDRFALMLESRENSNTQFPGLYDTLRNLSFMIDK